MMLQQSFRESIQLKDMIQFFSIIVGKTKVLKSVSMKKENLRVLNKSGLSCLEMLKSLIKLFHALEKKKRVFLKYERECKNK